MFNPTSSSDHLIQELMQGSFDPFWRWDQIQLHVRMALRQQIAGLQSGNKDNVRWMQLHEVTDPDFAPNISRHAAEIDEVSARDVDASIFTMTQLGRTGDPVNHSMRTAFICSLIAREQGMSDSERVTLVSAALTMNIAMLEMQEKLHYKQDAPLTDAQRAIIQTHPTKGREYLETFGVKNVDWLRAVEEHHEITGGKGYPGKLATVFPLAEIIQHADTYCAMTRPRAHRKALLANKAAYKLFVASRASTSSTPGLIVKMLGMFPPGTMVKLANGDVAVVLRRGDAPKAPKVASLVNATGIGYPMPQQRDTNLPEFAVVDVVAGEEAKLSIKPARLFGYDK